MPRRNSRKIAVLLIMTACMAAAGCARDEQPPSTPAKTAQPVPKPVQKSSSSSRNIPAKGVQRQATSSRVPVKAVQQQFTSAKRGTAGGSQLDFSGRKDPFKPFIVQPVLTAKKGTGQAKSQNMLPIQSYDVSKFKVVGIVAGLKENRALIVDPLRKGYVVKVGMQLGNNNGRITRISANTVEVLEQFRDDNGKLHKQTVTLVLTQKSKETVR